jgi:hypothetical protein
MDILLFLKSVWLTTMSSSLTGREEDRSGQIRTVADAVAKKYLHYSFLKSKRLPHL